MKTLSKNEEFFCSLLTSGYSVFEAAKNAGIKNPEKLLKSNAIKAKIKEINSRKNLSTAAAGLRRIAFSSIADAVRIAVPDADSRFDLDKMDLFSISEIKVGDKGVEIKFFDRQKALEALAETENDDSAIPFLEALRAGAERLGAEE